MFLENTVPTSVFLAKGSAIKVKNKRKLKTVSAFEEAYNY